MSHTSKQLDLKNQLIHHTETERLRSCITDTWSNWGPQRVIARSDTNQFGALTQNQQWIHVNEKRCQEESPYGALIVHGFFLLSLIPSLLPPESFEVVGHQQRIVRGSDHFRFPAPVFANECVHARARLRTVQSAESGKGCVLTRDVEVWSTTSTKPVVSCSLMLQYF